MKVHPSRTGELRAIGSKEGSVPFMVDDFSSAALLLVTGLDDIFYANSGFRDLRFVSCPFSVVVQCTTFHLRVLVV